MPKNLLGHYIAARVSWDKWVLISNFFLSKSAKRQCHIESLEWWNYVWMMIQISFKFVHVHPKFDDLIHLLEFWRIFWHFHPWKILYIFIFFLISRITIWRHVSYFWIHWWKSTIFLGFCFFVFFCLSN